MYPSGAANPKPHSTIRLDKHFIPAHSSRHRIAVIALYRALIALASSIQLPADLTREWHGAAGSKRRREAGRAPHPLVDIVRCTFKRNRNDTSPRIVAPALHAGYRSLGLLQDFKTSIARGETTTTTTTTSTTTAAEHEVLTLLREKLAERQRSVSAKLAWREARRTRPRRPRPKAFPPRPLNPTRLLVRTSRAPTPEDPYPEPIVYATPNHPLPLDEVRARYRRNTGAGDPNYVPPRNRFVPHVAMAGEFPFMRAGKRHHLAFTSVIRGKLEKRVREMAMFKRLEQFDVHDANTEDAWEGMLRRQAFTELYAGRDRERRAQLEEELRKIEREEREHEQGQRNVTEKPFTSEGNPWEATRQGVDRRKDRGLESSHNKREDSMVRSTRGATSRDSKLSARRIDTASEQAMNETDDAIDGMLWGLSPSTASKETTPPTSTPTLASSSPFPSPPSTATLATTIPPPNPSAAPTTAPTETTSRRIVTLINEQTADLKAMEHDELSATRFSHTTSIHGMGFLTARFRYARADYIARAKALRELVQREKRLHAKEVAESKRVRKEAWEARMAQLHGENKWRGVIAEEKRARNEARKERVQKMTNAALERVAALRSRSAVVRAVAEGMNGRGNGKEGVGQRDPDTWRRLRGRTETKGVPVVHVPYEWEVRGVDAMISDARARGLKPVKPREYPKAKGKDP